MSLIKRLGRWLLVATVLLVLLAPYWLKIVPTKYLLPFTGKLPLVDQQLCRLAIQVSGESLDPLVKPGNSLDLTRCFATTDLQVGTVVLFRDNANQRLSLIRSILPLEPVVYVVSDEKAPTLFHNVLATEVVALSNEVDVSRTRYQAELAPASFILDPGKYLTDLYLGKINREGDIDQSVVTKTTVFSRTADKFCWVIVPQQELRDVDIEIIDRTTQAVTSLGQNIVYQLSAKPNTNCLAFGASGSRSPETLNLEPGSYQFRLLLQNQAIASFDFKVI